MSKLNKKIINLFYAVIYQFIIIPLLGFISYIIYDKIAYLGIIQDNRIWFYILIIFLVAFNVICIYGIAVLYAKVYKANLTYYTIIGMCTIFASLWAKVYFYVLEDINCVEYNNSTCLDTLKNNSIASTVLIMLIAYYLVYIVLYKMLVNSKKKEGEKKQ